MVREDDGPMTEHPPRAATGASPRPLYGTTMHVPPPAQWSIYGTSARPQSAGRMLLADVLEVVMSETCGLDGEGIAAAFADPSPASEDERASIRSYYAWLGPLFLDGSLVASVRPIGGGEPASLPASRWEVDDYEPRFARSALDPVRWQRADAEPTHWIFVSEPSFATWWEAWCAGEGDDPGPERLPISVERVRSPGEPAIDRSKFLRLPEVMALTGMSRSTLYERIRTDGFPRQIRLGERMSRWREEDVRTWMARQTSG